MDWVTISALATAGGTLALAVATYASTQSANRNARVAEIALRQQLRPVVMNSNLDDPDQKIGFYGGHWVRVPGSGAVVEHDDGIVYLSMSLRNVGTGIAVLLGWFVTPDFDQSTGLRDPAPADQFRMQSRDLWIPANGIGLWQGAFRDDSEELHGRMREIAANPQPFLLDLLYTDHLGARRSVSRFLVSPMLEDKWLCAVTRHWEID
jgi:hypothetical protein